ncbi:MAG: glycosyltransferase [Candidatus Omnitrophica bacterium]|nr:glycosyltransferase [Candidatus Omnitrophota bacterium]MDD5080259.1 glycosyltransferase [Candidatus Omnitrophota bacterium]
MISICHIVDALNIGGLEKTLIGFVLNAREFKHVVFCLRAKGPLVKLLEDRGIEVREFSLSGRLRIRGIMRVTAELRKGRFDIVHCHGLYPAVWGAISARMAGVAVVIMHVQNQYYGISWKDKIKVRTVAAFTDRVIAVSLAVRKCLIGFLGIPCAKIALVYNSAEDRRSSDSLRRKVRERLGLAPGVFVVGSISRIEGHKGHSFLVESIAECLRRGLDCKCVIIGDGPAMDGLRNRVKSLGLENTVIFLGARQDAEDYLLGMDIFVQLSTTHEGLPLALAEAASAGLCLIATDIGGNAEIVQDGVNGFIVPVRNSTAVAEKIIYLAGHEDEMRKMSRESRNTWESKFSQREMVDKIAKIYKDEISKRNHTQL